MDFNAFVARKREEAQALRSFDAREVTPSIRDFEYYVQTFKEDLSLIGEIRRADPVRGPLAVDLDVAKAARALEAAGCSALAVMSDSAFGCRPEDLLRVSQVVSFPVLRKDLILTREQVYQSRALGADAIWLEASVLSVSELTELQEIARMLHMDSVIGATNEDALEKALRAQGRILGIGAGTPLTGGGKLTEALKLAAKVPSGRIVILDALLETPEELNKVRGKVDSALLGVAVIGAEDLTSRAEEFCNVI